MGTHVIMWALSLAFMVFLPRFLGAAGVGKFHFVSSLWAIMAVFIAFGSDTLLTKETARYPERTSALLAAVLVLRSLIFIVCYAVLIILLYTFDYPAATVTVAAIVGIASLLRHYGGACQAVLQGLEKMEYISLSDISSNVFYTVLGILLLVSGWGINAIAILMILAAVISCVIQLFFLHRIHPLQFTWNQPIIVRMFKEGAPYFLSSLFLVLYIQVDVITILWFVDETTIGWYSAADRLFGMFLFVPSIYITAAFPTFSRLFVDNPAKLQKLISKSFDSLFLLSVPIGFGLIAIANPLVILIFGAEFANSGPILAVFGIVLILTYQNILFGRFLIAADRQNAWTIVMALATLATVLLDALLIPWCAAQFHNGAIGGALSFVVTEAAMMLMGLYLLPKGSLQLANLWTAGRVLIAGILMLLVVWPLQHFFIAIPIFVGALTYLSLIFLLRLVPREDREVLWELMQQLQNKLHPPQASVLNS